MRLRLSLVVTALLCACNSQPEGGATNQQQIKVRGAEQDQLHKLDAMNLAIGLKRAIYSAGLTCRQIRDAGFVGEYKNMDMWMARCPGRDWAVFAGADGSAQVRDCKDLPGTGVPECKIIKRPEGSFTELQ